MEKEFLLVKEADDTIIDSKQSYKAAVEIATNLIKNKKYSSIEIFEKRALIYGEEETKINIIIDEGNK